ncbi:hypothetical protein BLA18628_01008 [Burkholderia aenigmatica]|uniref:DUF4062 domain-containing protein n=1 Tax=Burkholderia aenigmatica TaxID=2015348 RepID=UPI001452CD22|nr:DUF4062 domain-containing protein [Burkholderia aenigmatica]VWC77891.1 hypothetical protein BLA18628_01008 [Burkholderia aenigmatica]
MDKRYQVFVSSTYADLADERRQVIQTLMEIDCIPAGMELFPATDDEQWEFIKKIIDDCDYYVLIVGNRYGSLSADGISYTEKEFDYAISKGIKVLAFVHGSPENISFGKSEADLEKRELLAKFRAKVTKDRVVKFWNASSELPNLVGMSLTKTIKVYPAVGWIRASHAASETLLGEINDLRRQNAELVQAIVNLKHAEAPSGIALRELADFDSPYLVTFRVMSGKLGVMRNVTEPISWREIFNYIGPHLSESPNEDLVSSKLAMALANKFGHEPILATIDDDCLKTIGIQLSAYGLLEVKYAETTKGGYALFWILTPHGQKTVIESRVIRKQGSA